MIEIKRQRDPILFSCLKIKVELASQNNTQSYETTRNNIKQQNTQSLSLFLSLSLSLSLFLSLSLSLSAMNLAVFIFDLSLRQ